ncbi:KEOPS complex subunit Pcc1 [Candidatus Methanomassiliicoccus intestinalis]|uniref:KEOPS complex subunit Pcc1 n=1 Tax=Candidatus Methanomassiliicoccus intestinalis TaxID=1406512 RepID=UPI0037DCDB8E
MPKAVLQLDTPHEAAVWSALFPEIGREVPRTHVEISRKDGGITLSIDATDIGALRAALNSYIRWIAVSEDIANMAGD